MKISIIFDFFHHSLRKITLSSFLFVLLFLLTACPQNSSSPTSLLPHGWHLKKGYASMLARSYPNFSWLTLIITPHHQNHLLFKMPIPSTKRKTSLLKFLIQRQTRRSPFARHTPPKKLKSSSSPDGFLLWIRSSHRWTIELRVQMDNPLSLPITFSQKILIHPTTNSWKRYFIPFSRFKPLLPGLDATFHPHALTNSIEIWGKCPKKNCHSITLTLQNPTYHFPSRHSTTQPASRPTSQPASHPTTLPTTQKTHQ